MNRNFKYLFIYKYIDFAEREYLPVLNSFRTFASMSIPIGLYLYTKNNDFIWLSLCCFLWSMQIYTQNQSSVFLKNMLTSLVISAFLQIIGFAAHVHVIVYCLFSFIMAFLIPYFAYFKKSALYNLNIYFIMQSSTFFEKDIIETSKNILYSTIAFFIVLFIGTYCIRFNIKKQMMYRLKVNLNLLLSYLHTMKQFIFTASKKDHELLGKKRDTLFKSVQIFRDLFSVYKISNPDDMITHIVPIQERFIETTIGFCVQIRNIHTTQIDEEKIKDRFQKIRDIILRQRGLIFEAQFLTIHDILTRYQNIFNSAKNIEPISKYNTHFSKTELEEVNSAIFQFNESIALIEKDILNITITFQ